ncbi:HlyD family secretion protein [Persicobacter psychrovividus]|uniref:YbhG-like alpha-helical hairpin domain-containing protein n=1 Tax=Persicobacter psychrovividus TaxID=387638 RepID=A0ABM7VL50_9BACT|nr:hypothetical protein PEPS_39910 [Persicobacter psychrovividus]
MKKLTIISLAVATLLAACNSNEQAAGIKGKVKKSSIAVAPKVPGRILSLKVEEGDFVRAGDTLAILDIPEVEAKKHQAEGALLAAKAQYEMALNGATAEQFAQIDAKLSAVKEQYDFASKSFHRMKNMYEDSLISAQKFDEVKMKYIGAKAQYEGVLAKKKEVTKGVRNEKVRMALGTMQRAEGAVELAKVAESERFVIAPKSMEISTITLKEGELSLAGYSLFVGWLPNSTFFRFTVAESEVNQYKVGAVHTVYVPYLDKSIKAKVSKVSALTKYADRTTAYPTAKLGESAFEIQVKAIDQQEANHLFVNTNALIKD